MIRSLFLNIFIGLVTLFFCAIAMPLALFDKEGRLIHTYIAAPWGRIILWACGVKVDVRGGEKLDPAEPRVFLVNHQSFFDIFILLAHLRTHFKFVLKQELMRIPVLGFTMKQARYISIDRDNPRKAVKSMNEAAERIKDGASIVVFPEGTRSLDGRLQAFKRGGFLLALKAGSLVVPVTIHGSTRIAPKGSRRIHPTTVGMTVGEAVSLKGYTRKNINDFMTRMHELMRVQLGEMSR